MLKCRESFPRATPIELAFLYNRGLCMSSPMVKGVKRSPLRSTSRQSATTGRTRTLAGKSVRLKPITKRSSTGKAPAKKAKKSGPTSAARGSAARGKAAAKKKALAPKGRTAKPQKTAKPRKAAVKTAPVARPSKPKPVPAKLATSPKPVVRHVRQPLPPPPPPKPTRDEAAALKAFEKAHKEFSRGRFAEARNQFRALVEKYSGVSEVTARARTYLAIAETRLRT